MYPLAIESSGYLHSSFIKHLKEITKHAAALKRIPNDTLMNYVLKRISFRLQYCFANNIIKKTSELNGYCLGYNPVWNDSIIYQDNNNVN